MMRTVPLSGKWNKTRAEASRITADLRSCFLYPSGQRIFSRKHPVRVMFRLFMAGSSRDADADGDRMLLEPLQNETPECPAGFCAYTESEDRYHLYIIRLNEESLRNSKLTDGFGLLSLFPPVYRSKPFPYLIGAYPEQVGQLFNSHPCRRVRHDDFPVNDPYCSSFHITMPLKSSSPLSSCPSLSSCQALSHSVASS